MLQDGTPVPFPNMVILWDIATGTELKRWSGFQTGVWSVAFSPDGKILAAGSGTPTGPIEDAVRLWDVTTGELEAILREDQSVSSIAFSPDGKTLASGGWRGITLWDIVTRESTASLSSRTAIGSISYSPDGMLLASSYFDIVGLWDTTTNQEQATLDGHY
jgi:WD40 repeat protein